MKVLSQVLLGIALAVPFIGMMSAQTVRLGNDGCESWVGSRTCASVLPSRKSFEALWANSGGYYFVTRADAVSSEAAEDLAESEVTQPRKASAQVLARGQN